MFKHLHHQTWFPFVLIGLSLTLVLFIVWSFLARQNNPAADYESGPAVTAEQYQREVFVVFDGFWDKYRNQADDASCLAFVSGVEQKMLALKVPAESRSVHFELVSSLELLRQGLVGDSEKLESGIARLEKAYRDNPWLTGE